MKPLYVYNIMYTWVSEFLLWSWDGVDSYVNSYIG